jgi:pyridoxine 5-phosphate synthase
MTRLSVNINKIALLRNARGRNFPDVRAFAERCLAFGAQGITLHPRPDQRHARYDDVAVLKSLCVERSAELNVEGYPSSEFMAEVLEQRPHQCTLVPDAPGQITSDHGWNLRAEEALLRATCEKLREAGVRVSLFVDYDNVDIARAREFGADRVELYTEPYAEAHDSGNNATMIEKFREAAGRATKAGLGVNAGHDLNLRNLADLLSAIPAIEEVSIGHALIVESLEFGLEEVIWRYLGEIKRAAQ